MNKTTKLLIKSTIQKIDRVTNQKALCFFFRNHLYQFSSSVSIFILLSIASVMYMPAHSAVAANQKQTKPFYAIVRGQEINLNDDKSLLIEKLGEPTNDSNEQTVWIFEDGVTFFGVFTDEKLLEATLSSSFENEESFVVLYDEKNHLNTQNIEVLEDKYQRTYRCLSYFEQEKLGWLDYMIKDNSGNDYYATFSAINTSGHSLNTLEGKIQTKVSLVDSITLRQGRQNFSTKIYCKKKYQRNEDDEPSDLVKKPTQQDFSDINLSYNKLQ